jgi:Acetyltransferase (GNAT) domain
MTNIDTPRLILREFVFADSEAMNCVFGDAEVMKYGDSVKTPQWVEMWITRWIDELYPTWGFGMWPAVEKAIGTVVGYFGLSRFPGRCAKYETEIGFRLRKTYWGRGFAAAPSSPWRGVTFTLAPPAQSPRAASIPKDPTQRRIVDGACRYHRAESASKCHSYERRFEARVACIARWSFDL